MVIFDVYVLFWGDMRGCEDFSRGLVCVGGFCICIYSSEDRIGIEVRGCLLIFLIRCCVVWWQVWVGVEFGWVMVIGVFVLFCLWMLICSGSDFSSGMLYCVVMCLLLFLLNRCLMCLQLLYVCIVMFLMMFSIGILIFLNIFSVFFVFSVVMFCGVVMIIVLVSGIFWVRVSWMLFVFGGRLISRKFRLFYRVLLNSWVIVEVVIGLCQIIGVFFLIRQLIDMVFMLNVCRGLMFLLFGFFGWLDSFSMVGMLGLQMLVLSMFICVLSCCSVMVRFIEVVDLLMLFLFELIVMILWMWVCGVSFFWIWLVWGWWGELFIMSIGGVRGII